MQFFHALSLCAGLLALTACDNTIPIGEGEISPQARAARYPELVPLSPLVNDAGRSETVIRAGDTLAARAASLRRRAAALRGRDVFDGQEALRNL